MDKSKKFHIAISIMITMFFVCIGIFLCRQSFERLGETLLGLCSSVKFYFCQVFGIKVDSHLQILEPSNILIDEILPIPSTSSIFWLKCKGYFTLLINRTNIVEYFSLIGGEIGAFSKVVIILLPILLIGLFIVKKIYNIPNTRYNQDTFALSFVKKISNVTYQPLKRLILGYKQYIDRNPKWKIAWLWIWLANVNFLSVLIAFLAYYFYFAVSFDITSLYPQIVNLLKDLLLVIRCFPWFISGTIAWIIFVHIREKIAMKILLHHEAKNCGFIKELPIVSMSCGSMGKKKTTLNTDMALSQTVMFRQEAFTRLQKQDMKFPFFPWICLENELKACMEYGTVYNLASIHTFILKKRNRYEKHGQAELQLYGYDTERYGLYFDNALKQEYLFDVLETYAKLYFIYVIESSLLVANYSIREEDVLYDEGNFPMWSFNFFPKRPNYENSRFAHILDFDVLRLGKKVIENNPNAGSFEFGVVVITEVGKERANNLELKEIKKNAEETNQKNDLFNAWLKMCRHSATVDNFPFIKVFTDEQRPESWGADARELADILTIANSGTQRLALPFYTIEQMIFEWSFAKFISLYYDLRFKRGDNTLLVYLLKNIVSKIWAHNERIYNRFGYSVLSIEKERGTQDGKTEKKRYFLSNYKIYRERFTTDCFSDYFNELALKSGVGLMDYLTYKTVRASVDELKKQNSYFINGLYGA